MSADNSFTPQPVNVYSPTVQVDNNTYVPTPGSPSIIPVASVNSIVAISPPVNTPLPKEEPVLKYDQIDFNKIIQKKIERKTADTANGKINYMQIPYAYNYGTVEAPKERDFTFEGPKVTSYGGLQKKIEGNKVTYSINVSLPESLRREDQRGFLDTLEYLNDYVVSIIEVNKAELNQAYFDVTKPQALLKSIVYTPVEKGTINPIPGAIKSTYFKVNKGGGFLIRPTLFTLPDGTPITDWSLLEEVDMTFIPKLKFTSTFVGSATKMSTKVEIVSAVITDITPRNSVSTQIETIEQHKHLTSIVQEQIKKLQLSKSSAITPIGPKIIQDQNINATQMNIGGHPNQPQQSQQPQIAFRPSFPGLPPANPQQQPQIAFRPPSSASAFYASTGTYQQAQQ